MGFKEQVEENLAKAARIGRTGWGDKIAIGILIGYLDPITPQQAYEYISSRKNLFDNLSEQEWEHYRELAKGTALFKIDTARILKELKKRHLDLSQIITNTPGGVEWLDNEVKRLREKLGLLTT